ncbi:MAG: UvrD-helicase domain-containing protein [bacterium]
MEVFAIPSATAEWLLGKANLLDVLHDLVLGSDDITELLQSKIFVEGAVRMSSNKDRSLIVFWNQDYMTSVGDDCWGIINISDVDGLACEKRVSRETFERALYIISQRSQGLLLDGAFIHRSYPNGSHSCLAGRGNEARQISLGYVENCILVKSQSHKLIAITGPMWDLGKLSSKAAALKNSMGRVLAQAKSEYSGAIRKKALSPSEFTEIREILAGFAKPIPISNEFASVSVATGEARISASEVNRTLAWSYSEWLRSDSALSPEQRGLLEQGSIQKHPVRITGPAGSGKTLLMQLLAIWRAKVAEIAMEPIRILYLVHNEKMAEMVRHRFGLLLQSEVDLFSEDRVLESLTLSEYARRELSLEIDQVIDNDAQAAKEFQLETLRVAITDVFEASTADVKKSKFFSNIIHNDKLMPVLQKMIMAEISIAIKGRGLQADMKRYVDSEKSFSRLHGMLDQNERKIIFDVFRSYNETMFDGYQVLDTDDVALSLLGRLRTPMWQMKRREYGYDHVFVDETQLFNENERRLLALMTKSTIPFVPVTMALDDAQELYGQSTAGLGTLGIEDLASKTLASVHRSSIPIVRLAFFIIQRSIDLFSSEFPEFRLVEGSESGAKLTGTTPKVVRQPIDQQNFERFVINTIRGLRKDNFWRIAVVTMAEVYWRRLLEEFRRTDLPLHVLEQRGVSLPMSEPVVVLSRPEHVGGQEFDAVVLVGAEAGIAPPRVIDNEALASAVEQQSLREYYLSITRARSQVLVLLSSGESLSPVLEDAVKAGLLDA